MSNPFATMKPPANQGALFGAPRPEGGREMVASALASPAPPPTPPAEDGSAPGSVVGVVVKAKQKPDGWSILTMDVDGVSVAWVGVMPPVHEGQVLMGIGTYETDKYRGGLQLKVDAIVPHVVKTVAGIEAYLAGKGIKGIGKGNAKKIVQHFGLLTVDILDINPDRIVEVKGITADKAAAIAKAWAETRAEAAVAIFLLDHGASPSVARKIVERYGKRARWIVENNPYKLAEDINGVGFKKADEIAKKVGIAHDSPERAQAGTIFVLREQTDKGHCFTFHDDLVKDTAKLLTVTYDLVREAIVQLTTDEKVVRCATGPDGKGDAAIYSKEMHRAETYVARRLLMLRDAPLAPDAESKEKPVAERVDAAIKAFESDAKITLAPAQREAVEAVAREKILVITGGPGVGKATEIHAKVLTPTGWRMVGELSVGDLVIDAMSGKATPVVGVYDQGELPVFRVTMDDGGSVLCSEDHLFLTKTRSDRRDRREIKIPPKSGSVKTVAEIMSTIVRAGDGGANHSIPLCAPAIFEPCGSIPIDPWMLGAYLGDGYSGKSMVALKKPEQDVLARFASSAPLGDRRGRRADPSVVSIIGQDGHRSATSNALGGLGLLEKKSHEKFIPEAYLRASVADRISLLQGLCDTDGTVIASAGKSIEYSTASPYLRDGILFLVGSLGGWYRCVERPTHYMLKGVRHEARTSYRITFAFPHGNIVPVSSEKHLAKWNDTPNRIAERFIRSVEPEGTAPCRCIALADDSSHLYITDDFVVTHNTAVTKAVLGAFRAAQVPVRFAAPTGRAAKRMSEATGHEAMTIHRMLGFNPETGGFMHTANNPIPNCGLLLLDEVSMLELQLTRDVLAATPTGARVVFVGDVDQLPSVGPGAVLRDVIDSGEIKTVRLTQIFRQAKGSQIIEQAHRINRGEMPVGDTTTSGEFYWVEREEEHAAAEAVIECVTRRIPSRFGISHDNIQVLTPMHKGEAGTTELNKALQAALNPSSGPELRRGEHTFRIRDRVIHKKNDSQRDVYNGDIGHIVSIEPDNKDCTIVCQFDGRLIEYTSKQVVHLKLAYALSTHSSQGGQFEAVVQVLLRRHYPMLSRNLLYTGVTRGKKLVVMIADRSAVKVALSAVRKEDRRTMLRQRLQGGSR